MKKAFLIALIGALSVSALMGVFIVLFGEFGEIEAKILMTTLSIGAFSITGLGCSLLFEKNKHLIVAQLGIFSSVISFLWTTLLVWEIIDADEGPIKVLMTLFVVTAVFAHSSLMLLIKSDKKPIIISLYSTIALTVIVALMLLYLIIFEIDGLDDEIFFRVLGAFAILDVFGTLLTPILKKLVK